MNLKNKKLTATAYHVYHQEPLSLEKMEILLTRAETRLSQQEAPPLMIKRVFTVLEELMGNILKHGIQNEATTRMPLVSLKEEAESYEVITGNVIKQEEIAPLKAHVHSLNALDRAAIKEKYNQVVMSGKISEKGGAGLGLITIAKLTYHKILINFESLNDHFAYVLLTIKIPKQNN